MLFLPIIEKTPSRRDRFPRVDTTTSNFSVPSGGGVGVLTLTRPIGLPPHAPVAQKIADQR